MAYRSYVSAKNKKSEEKILHRTVKQCHYCENYFVKTKDAMEKHTKVCPAKEGIIYTFENGKIISFQDHFMYLGDVPFTVYFDLETTTGDAVFLDPKMFVVSYYQIYSCLNLDKIVIFRSFQQSPEEIYDLNHFRHEHIPYFDKITFSQLKDAATTVLASEKSTLLSELFSVELKFTIDTLNDWFSNTIKPKFLELNDIKKQMFIKENPPVSSKTTCCVCGFLLDTQACREHKRWYDFIVQREHLFIRNIYTEDELGKMETTKDLCNYYDSFKKSIELVPIMEQALECPQWIKEKEKLEEFMGEDLNNVYAHLGEVKEAIDEVEVKKKIGKSNYIDKIICFIYSSIMKFCETDKVKGIPMSEKFMENIKGILKNETHIHHSHISGEILGYSRSYCNFKVRENKKTVSVIVHNLFRFDFSFFLKGIRAGSWRTRDISIGGKNATDINFACIGNQVVFIDTVKYFQQSLATLANTMTDKEKLAVNKKCKKFILRDENLSKEEDQEWVLNYLSPGKGAIPYEVFSSPITFILALKIT